MAKLKSGTRIYGTATIDTSVVVGSGVTINASGIIASAGIITATSFVGALTGTATSTTNIPNLTGAITSNNTTTSLGSFTSAQLATALTDETGSGANVFATSPVLVTPSLGIATATSIVVSSGSTFTNGPVFIGSATSTGTASQRLQVTGGAYVSGSVGIGTTNPTSTLQVQGTVSVSSTTTSAEFVGGGSGLRNLSGTHLVSYASHSETSNSALSIAGISTYNQVGILTGSYAVDANDNFGYSVATSADGKTIIVGAYNDEIGATLSTGVVYVYDRVGSSFNQVGILTGSYAVGAGDNFGRAVATSADGKTIIVGAYDDEIGANTSSGVVYVYDRVGSSFNQVGILTGSLAVDANDYFGISVATSADGKTIIVGAYNDEIGATLSTGVVYVYDRVGSSFNQVGILTGSYAVDANDNFGVSVATSADGKTIIIGAWNDEIGANTSSGVVYVYDRVGSSFNQVGILTGSLAVDANDIFGYSVATSADGKTIIVSAYIDEIGANTSSGVVYVFKRQGNSFNQVGILTGSLAVDASDNFGISVASSADGKTIIVGAYNDEIGANTSSGVVYVYDETRDTYVYSGPTGNIGIGTTNPTQPLQVQGNARITGAVYDSTNSPGTSGQVFQSTVSGTQWTTAAAGGGSGKFDTTIDNVLYVQPTGTLDIVGVGTTTTQITTLPSSSPEYIIHSLHVTNISNGDAEITAGFVMNARKVPASISVSVGSSGGPGIHTFTVGSASSITVGMAVTGTGNIGETTGIGSTAGFQFNTYVTSVDGNNITLNKPMSGRATGVLYFSPVSKVSSRLPVPVGSAVELLKQPMVLNALDSIVLQSTGAGSGIGSTSTAAITQAANSNFLTVTAGAAITNFLASGMLIQPTGNNTGIQTNTFVGVGYTPGALSIPMTRPATVALASTSLSFTEVVVPQDGALQVTVVYQSSTDTSYLNGTGTVSAAGTITSIPAGISSIPIAYYSTGTLYPSIIQSIRVSNISDGIIYPGGDYPVSVGIGNSDTIFSWLAYNMVIPKNSSIELCEAPKRIGIGQSIFAFSNTPYAIEIQIAGKQKTS